MYGLEDGKEKLVEREYLFREEGCYKEMAATPVISLHGLRVPELSEGRVMGSWLCIFAFHAHRLSPSFRIPSILSISRNPKLKSIPTLTMDLQVALVLISATEDKEQAQELSDGDRANHHGGRVKRPVFELDLNCLPDCISADELSEDQQTEQSEPGALSKKKTRAKSKDISRIGLEDLTKYFDLPIAEASKKLKVGLTVLKRKCREFGIPRWPHRKIKSLDGLIRDLQEEATYQQEKSEAAAMAVTKRQKMLEKEKETIERKPFMEIQTETKKFRQDIFKRRHKARALKNQSSSTSSSVEN